MKYTQNIVVACINIFKFYLFHVDRDSQKWGQLRPVTEFIKKQLYQISTTNVSFYQQAAFKYHNKDKDRPKFSSHVSRKKTSF